ncbi:MAG TPA: alpha/beta fold hydrolase [Acidimicrobiales bacterium]|nr:alpha/beta fold hydrolase [Acidimicrobiales bacterium]
MAYQPTRPTRPEAVAPGPTPIVLVPGLLATARLYAAQVPELWRYGPVTIADHTRDDAMDAIARRILADAPAHFALGGLSMGGYVALEIMRQAPERVTRLALLDTSARPDTEAQRERRVHQIGLATSGRFDEVPDQQLPLLVHADRRDDDVLRRLVHLMADETGPAAFVRQQRAITGRVDSRADLAAIRCPTLVLVGDGDALTPPDLAAELAEGIDGAHLVVVPDCGHLSSVERPEQVTTALVEWLAY